MTALPRVPDAVCYCGETVSAVPAGPRDWAYVDTAGRTIVDLPQPDWDWLRRNDIAEYSRLSAAANLGYLPTCHVHQPTRQLSKFRGSVPWCCAEPMRLTPSGWECRASRNCASVSS
jgi:hypothetical protein